MIDPQSSTNVSEFDITLILPVYNEEKYLGLTLESLAKQELGSYKAEVLVVDGCSSDRSFEIAKTYEQREGVCFRVIKNEKRIAAAALNIGAREARSGIIGFGGSHAIYPSNYLRLAAELIIEQHYDAVGGWCSFHSIGTGTTDKTMALLYTSPFGAGARRDYHKTEPAFVRTVFGGLFRRQIIEDCGGYDEGLARGQDIDFNLRVHAAGYKLLYHPGLRVDYIIKTEPKVVFKRAFLTSSSIADIFTKRGRFPSLHYLIPFGFLAYVLVFFPLSFLGGWWKMLAVPLIAYFSLLAASALQLSAKAPFGPSMLTIPVFFAYHIVYGAGVFYGYVKYFFPVSSKQKHFPYKDHP